MLRLVPPAGAPLRITQVLRALVNAIARGSHSDQALTELGKRLNVQCALGFSSGRAGLWAILKALHHLRPGKNVVALPAYVCFSVPASVVRAGLQIELVDVDPRTLDFDFAQLEEIASESLLCIIAPNLFGLPNDMARIQRVARAKEAYFVDNAAQGLGALYDGRFLGTTGDVGLYSLGRGKALTTLEGGIVVTNSDAIAEAIKKVAAGLPKPSIIHTAGVFLQMLAYALFLNPRVYWIPDSLPLLKLGVTDFDPGFDASALSSLCKTLLLETLGGLDAVNRRRRENADFLASALAGGCRFQFPKPTPNSHGVYTRFPLVAADSSVKMSALRKLREAGIGASPFYPSAICDLPAIGQFMARHPVHCLQAEELSRRLLTVPTHPYVQRADLETIVGILRGL